MADIIIIGSGPAGVSASLYCVRAGFNTVVISNNTSALLSTEKIDNYYGFPDGISGRELSENGISQAKKLGVTFINDEVFSIGYDGKFSVDAKSNSYPADGIIIATGSKRNTPDIQGLRDFEGRGVSYCAVCDAFFFRGKNVTVLGDSEYALHELNELLPLVNIATVLTNGSEPKVDFPSSVKVDTRKIAKVSGEAKLSKIIFSDGETLDTDGLFIACGAADSTALAKKIGAVTNGNKIRIDENMKTSVKRIYAAGDCTGGLLQISKAVYEGARAATELIKELRK